MNCSIVGVFSHSNQFFGVASSITVAGFFLMIQHAASAIAKAAFVDHIDVGYHFKWIFMVSKMFVEFYP